MGVLGLGNWDKAFTGSRDQEKPCIMREFWPLSNFQQSFRVQSLERDGIYIVYSWCGALTTK